MALTKVGKEGITGISNSSNATAITIDSSERVGIGTTSPSAHLQVETSANSPVLIKSTYATGGYVQHDTGANGANIGYMGSSNALVNTGGTESLTDLAIRSQGNLVFSTGGGTERMRITSGGNLLIGVSSFTSGGGGVQLGGTQATREFSASGTGAIQQIGFHNPNGEVGSIYSTGSSTVFATSSDYRLKENIDYSWDATTRLKQLKPARFNFISDDTNTVIDGFLAHEAATVVPESVIGTKDAVDEDGNIKPQGIDQAKLVPLLVKTIQELEARITALEAE